MLTIIITPGKALTYPGVSLPPDAEQPIARRRCLIGMRTLPVARTVVLAAVAVTVGLVAGCAARPQPDQQARPAATALGTVASPPGAPVGTDRDSIFGMAFNGPSLTFTGGSLYLTWQPTVQPNPPHATMSRVDPATGVIMASNTFSPGILSAPLYAAGWLWMTDPRYPSASCCCSGWTRARSWSPAS
jgi:hypothetical protein